jgi:hypothetical protein
MEVLLPLPPPPLLPPHQLLPHLLPTHHLLLPHLLQLLLLHLPPPVVGMLHPPLLDLKDLDKSGELMVSPLERKNLNLRDTITSDFSLHVFNRLVLPQKSQDLVHSQFSHLPTLPSNHTKPWSDHSMLLHANFILFPD